MGTMIGIPGLILILIVALLLFGPNKLPELGRAFGKTLKEFKRGTREVMEEDISVSKSEGNDLPPGGSGSQTDHDKRLPE